MKILKLIAVLLLAGCSLTPTQVRERGARYDAQSARGTKEVADCIAGNAEKAGASFTNTRAGPLPESYELSIFVVTLGETDTLASAQVRMKGTGSSVAIWISPQMIGPVETLPKRLMAGC
jgi:hypothetical protein